MKITVKPFKKRDGSVMFFINNDRKVSIGINVETGFQSSKATQGELKLWNAFCKATREGAAVAENIDIEKHQEFKFTMFNGISFAMTDVAEIAGVNVGSDGLFIVRNGRAMKPHFNVEE